MVKITSKEQKIVNVDLTNPADLVTFTEETLNGKLHFLCSECFKSLWKL